ncbi:MAG: molybdenum cofactor guanylyltransferase [Betaproteobacteria bacterium]|nr:molybdenum cofactor guanylyltransferase [Betaproteobacteria bacterium]
MIFPGILPMLSGAILAGGQGRRMDGADKGLQSFRGKPLVVQVHERLRPQVDEILISANRNIPDYAALVPEANIVADRISGFAGPLAGLHATLVCARHPLLLTAPCDTPFLPQDLAERLHAALVRHKADLAFACVCERHYPTFSLCRRELFPALEAFLDSGGRKANDWLETINAVPVAFDDQADAFLNINTREDLLCHESGRK